MFGLAFGSSVHPDESAYRPYDVNYEREEAAKAMKTAQGHVAPGEEEGESFGLDFGSGGRMKDSEIPQEYLPYDQDFERKNANAVRFNGKGYFLDRDWLYVDGDEVVLNARRPLLLYTHPQDAAAGAECRKAHEQHAFVALVHLLRSADVGSTVLISMPYFTDLYVLDELCYFAGSPEWGGRYLTVCVILTETKDNLEYLNKFIGNSPTRQEAILRLGLRSTPKQPGHCHTKAVWSTAGVMTGSYNFTTSGRKYDREHGFIVGPDHPDSAILREQLQTIWDGARPMVRRNAGASSGAKKRSLGET